MCRPLSQDEAVQVTTVLQLVRLGLEVSDMLPILTQEGVLLLGSWQARA